MGTPPSKKIKDRTPAPVFKSIAKLERVKSMMLGRPVPHISRLIPFGYEVDPDVPNMLRPINREFALLIRARDYLATSSYYEVAAWLSKASGKKITHTGLHKIIRERFPIGIIGPDGQYYTPATT